MIANNWDSKNLCVQSYLRKATNHQIYKFRNSRKNPF